MNILKPLFVVSLFVCLASLTAKAGVFNIPHFVAPGEFAIGLEPDLRLNQGSGLGANIKYTQGITDMINAQGILGDGGGSSNFRIGGNASFDFFPDTKDQPGLGLATQALYYRVSGGNDLPGGGDMQLTGIPYIHKALVVNGDEIEPFLALPFGWDFGGGTYHWESTLALGSMFKDMDNFRFSAEVGISLSNAQSYISGGVTYYH